MDLHEEFGAIDIYLFDQLLRGRIRPGMRVLDAGCGSGRNLHFLLRAGYDVLAIDADRAAIASVRQLAAMYAPRLTGSNFRVETIEETTFPAGAADVVISNSVLHFARDDDHFAAMMRSMWRLLVPEGLFFCRLASVIGLESRVRRTEGRRFVSPDGEERYLVNEAMLLELTEELGGDLLDPIKTTVVQDQRSMTTWVVRRTG